MSDEEIKSLETAGEITLTLKRGSDAESESLLNCIESTCGIQERLRLERWIADGMPDA